VKNRTASGVIKEQLKALGQQTGVTNFALKDEIIIKMNRPTVLDGTITKYRYILCNFAFCFTFKILTTVFCKNKKFPFTATPALMSILVVDKE
jgi:hypothetical protein